MTRLLIISGTMLALVSCSGSPKGAGAFSEALSASTAEWAEVDFSGDGLTWTNAPMAATGSTKLRFRRIGSGAGAFFISIQEVTQAQWQALAGTQPWTEVPAGVVPAEATAPDRPAFNLAADEVRTVLARYRTTKGGRLAVPTDAQWHRAAGVTNGWWWGDALNHADLAAKAVVRDTGGWDTGPRLADRSRANARGVMDLHGNVWEWTEGATRVRGGSWFDGVWQARAEQQLGADQGLESTMNCALVGLRLVLVP